MFSRWGCLTDCPVGLRDSGCAIWLLRYGRLSDIDGFNRLVSRWYRLHERNVPVKRFFVNRYQRLSEYREYAEKHERVQGD